MSETFLTELKNALFTEKVKPGQELHISRGQKIVFGSDPKKGLNITPDIRCVKLAKGIKPHQLSRAAVVIEFNQTGGITIKPLTENNQVNLQYQSKEKSWQTHTLGINQAINPAKFTNTENMSGQLTIDITTENGTLIRLYCCGGNNGNNPTPLDRFDFRVDLNPIRDLNNSK